MLITSVAQRWLHLRATIQYNTLFLVILHQYLINQPPIHNGNIIRLRQQEDPTIPQQQKEDHTKQHNEQEHDTKQEQPKQDEKTK